MLQEKCTMERQVFQMARYWVTAGFRSAMPLQSYEQCGRCSDKTFTLVILQHSL